MNTILQQRIEESSIEYTMRTGPRCIAGGAFSDMAMEINKNPAFIAGANYALQNQWISVDEALPEFEGNFSDYYIIRTEDGWCAVTMYYRTSEKEYWWNFEKTKVTHWMEIPKLKGGEK